MGGLHTWISFTQAYQILTMQEHSEHGSLAALNVWPFEYKNSPYWHPGKRTEDLHYWGMFFVFLRVKFPICFHFLIASYPWCQMLTAMAFLPNSIFYVFCFSCAHHSNEHKKGFGYILREVLPSNWYIWFFFSWFLSSFYWLLCVKMSFSVTICLFQFLLPIPLFSRSVSDSTCYSNVHILGQSMQTFGRAIIVTLC